MIEIAAGYVGVIEAVWQRCHVSPYGEDMAFFWRT